MVSLEVLLDQLVETARDLELFMHRGSSEDIQKAMKELADIKVKILEVFG